MGEPEDGRLGIDRRARAGARWGLAALVLGTVACLAVAVSNDPNPPFIPPKGATTDVDVFRKVATRVGRGDSFYDATQQEFRAHGYPTRSVFNWRTPIYAWFLGRVTGFECGRWLLMAGVLLVVLLASRDLVDDCGIVAGAGGVVSIVGAMAWCCGGNTVFFTELWSGMLIALSVCALRRRWTAAGVVLGLTALFFRELALPYVLVALALAVWEGRRREAVAWLVGLGLFLAFMTAHTAIVQSRVVAADTALEGGWVRFGGLRFLLTATQVNVFLMPLWISAFFLPVSCLGLARMVSNGGTGRLVGWTVAVYLAAFSVVGNPFNFYWGFTTAPLLAMGVGYAPGELRRLARLACRRERPDKSALAPVVSPA